MIIVSQNPKSWKLPVAVKNGRITEVFNYQGAEIYSRKTGEFHKTLMVDNFVFRATLVPDGFYRGRSAAGFVFKDKGSDLTFTMRIAKVEELLKELVEGGLNPSNGIDTLWTFFKQGENYSIGLYKEK